MSEKLKDRPESHETQPDADIERLISAAEHRAEQPRKGEKEPSERIEEARDHVEEAEERAEQANPLEELQKSEKAAKPAPAHYVSRELRKATLNRQMASIRHSLSVPGRTFSKVIHQPVVRVISEPAAKTVSRPSGLLGGGLMAFLGTTGYLYLARSAGMQYNYFVFIALFIGGFAVGLVLELLIHMATIHRRQAND